MPGPALAALARNADGRCNPAKGPGDGLGGADLLAIGQAPASRTSARPRPLLSAKECRAAGRASRTCARVRARVRVHTSVSSSRASRAAA